MTKCYRIAYLQIVSGTKYHKWCSSITADHNDFLEPTLLLVMRINAGHIVLQPTLIFSRKLVWVIICFCSGFDMR